MSPNPNPLPADWALDGRFVVRKVLGRGGFGIAYLCDDLQRHDQVVVKELAPIGTPRREDGVLDLDATGSSGHALRHRFLDEAEVLRRFNCPGIPALRAAFAENGTAYYVTGYLPKARTLEEKLRREGWLNEDDAFELFVSLLDILEVVHAAGVLHRDVKPTNVLLGANGEVVLIDFGSARDWVSEVANTHTVMHTPGFAPPEQMSERALRGPGTDLYGLCATIYNALTRRPPATAAERVAGIPLTPIRDLCPDIDPIFAGTIESGLEPRLVDRPKDVAAMRAMLQDNGPVDSGLEAIEQIDETLCRLATFRFDRRACPNCHQLIHDARPLRKGQCPVCHEGTVRLRKLDEDRCPFCRIGRIERLDNSGIPAICPKCSHGRMLVRRKSLISQDRVADCDLCHAHYEISGATMTLEGQSASLNEWRARLGRSEAVWDCISCDGLLDVMPDGRLQQVFPASAKTRVFYPEEWARIAAGLEPSAGNAWCDACSADYWVEDDRMTLLDAPRDPYGFGRQYTGRAIATEDARWLGIGKSSGLAGLICEACHTEFDRDGEFHRLIASPNRELTEYLGLPKVLEDWHRLAQGLPTINEVAAFEESIEPILRQAYHAGTISFDDAGTVWRGKAVRTDSEEEGILTVTQGEINYGRVFRKWRVPLDALLQAEAEGDSLTLFVSGQAEPVHFEVVPVELAAHLKSGSRDFEVTAEDLVARLATLMI